MTGKLRELMAAARATADLAPLVEAVPCARFLGMALEIDGEGLRGRMRYAPHLVGNPMVPALHGGAVASFVESVAVFHLLWTDAELEVVPKTISITFEFLRSAAPRDTLASAEVLRKGRRLATVRIGAWQEDRDRLVVSADAHFLLAR